MPHYFGSFMRAKDVFDSQAGQPKVFAEYGEFVFSGIHKINPEGIPGADLMAGIAYGIACQFGRVAVVP